MNMFEAFYQQHPEVLEGMEQVGSMLQTILLENGLEAYAQGLPATSVVDTPDTRHSLEIEQRVGQPRIVLVQNSGVPKGIEVHPHEITSHASWYYQNIDLQHMAETSPVPLSLNEVTEVLLQQDAVRVLVTTSLEAVGLSLPAQDIDATIQSINNAIYRQKHPFEP